MAIFGYMGKDCARARRCPPPERLGRRLRRWGQLSALLALLMIGCESGTDITPTDSSLTDPSASGASQTLQSPQVCQTCHARQYREVLQSVMSGYGTISPAFNALELAGNFLAQGALEAGLIRNNLRPVYETPSAPHLPRGANMISAERYDDANEVRAAFCIGCHAGAIILQGEDPDRREIPEWEGISETSSANGFPIVRNVRPLRDYHFVNDAGAQVLPATPGGPPPPASHPSLGSQGALCDHCHNVQGPALQRSLQGDGFANVAQLLEFTRIKVGPFDNPLPVGPLPNNLLAPHLADDQQSFHASSSNPDRITYLRSSAFCVACHDVRVPNQDLVAPEADPSLPDLPVPYFRLENLGTELVTQAYAFAEQNPFNQEVRCQDCHMSLYPHSHDVTYTVHDEESGRDFEVTSPRPAVFPLNRAAVAVADDVDPTGAGIPLPERQVVTHYFTGIDNPLVYTDCDTAATQFGRTDCVGELRERLGDDRVDTFAPGVDEYGIPLSIDQRRSDLLEASVRLFLNATDDEAQLGEPFHVRVTAIALTGHNFPAGFSQERTAWIELNVTAKLSADNAHLCDDLSFARRAGESQFCRDGEFILYQSGYLIDKPHPETGEVAPDGNLDDEDLEHLTAVVNPFNHHNEIFEEGVDNGPLARIFEGEPIGLVLFRNELLRIYGPACIPAEGAPAEGDCPAGTRATGIAASNRNHPRTGEILTHILEEETFSAGAANTVDNWRSLPPLDPKTFVYEIELPSQQELAELGVEVEGPLRIEAKLHFLHFPPLFLRFLARVSGAVPYALPPATGATTMPYSRVADFEQQPVSGYSDAAGLRGPADHDYQLFDEQRIDDLLRTVRDISIAERLVPLHP